MPDGLSFLCGHGRFYFMPQGVYGIIAKRTSGGENDDKGILLREMYDL